MSLSRGVWCVALVAWLSLGAACAAEELTPRTNNGAAPRIKGLVNVLHSSQRPERDIRQQWPYLPRYEGQSEANPNPQYIVQATDVIELYVESATQQTPNLNLSLRYPGGPQEGFALIRDVRRPKFPAGLLVDRQDGHRVERILFRMQPNLDAELDPTSLTIPGARWSQLQTLFAGMSVGTYPLKVRLIAARAERAAVGDVIRMYRLQMNPKSEQRIEEYTLQVDADGFIWLPPATSGLVKPGTALSEMSPHIRGLMGAVDNGYFRVHVWYPGRAATDQPTLQEIARRLSSLSTKFADADLQDWQDADVDEQFLPADADSSGVRYRLVLVGERTWTLVDENGQRHTCRHSGRELLVEAVLEAYRTALAHELVEGATGSRSIAFLTVIPRGISDEPARRPFFGRVDSGDIHCQLRNLSLEVGDTVFVSRGMPKAQTAALP